MLYSNSAILAQTRVDLANYIASYAEGVAYNSQLARIIEEDRYSIQYEIDLFERTADFDSFYDVIMSFDTVVREAFDATVSMVCERYDYDNAEDKRRINMTVEEFNEKYKELLIPILKRLKNK